MLYKNRNKSFRPASSYSMKGSCILAIEALNSKSNVEDADLKKIKVAGKDEVSRIPSEKFSEMISKKDYDVIKENFTCYKEREKVIRWMLRGLSLPLAMRKTVLSRRFQYK